MRGGRSFLLACLLVSTLGTGLSACGEETGEPSSASPGTSPSGEVREPRCDEFWVDGQPLAEGYAGCSEADGTWVEAEKKRCDSGQVLVTYDDRFYGALGAVVNDVGGPLEDDPTYRRAIRSCG